MPKKRDQKKIINKKHLARAERERRQTRLTIIVSIAIFLLVVGTIGYGVLYNSVIMGNQPVAKVGSTTISTRDWQVQVRYERFVLISQYNQLYQFYSSLGMDPATQQDISSLQAELSDPATLANQVLTRMINDIVVQDEAAKMGISVTSQEIDQAIQTAFGYFPNGTPTPTITPTPFSTPPLNPTEIFLITPTPTPTMTPIPTITPTPSFTPTPAATLTPTTVPTITPVPSLAPTSTPYTLAGYQEAVQNFISGAASQGVTGISESELRNIIAAQLYNQKMEKAETKDVKPIQEQVWARHIVLPDKASADAALARINGGQDWSTVCADVSIDTATKNSGGDLGWFPKGIQEAALTNEAFSLQPGQIGGPVQTAAGWELIQVIGHELRPVDSSTLQQLQNTAYQDWINTTKAGFAIEIYSYWTQRVPTQPALAPTP